MARGRKKAAVLNAPVEGPWELPEGWRWERLGNIATPSKGKYQPDPKSSLPFVGLDSIAPHSIRLEGVSQFSEMRSAANAFSAGQILYGRLRPYLNKVWLADRDGACSGEFIVLNCAADIEPAYLRWILHHSSFVSFASHAVSGDRPRIDFKTMSAYSVPVPPLETQRRIVARIDELFSELDDGETALAHAREDLEIYRKALLKAAVTGELTADWRAANPCTETGEQLLKRILAERKSSSRSNRQAIREIEDAHLWGIPKTWAWCRTDVAGFVQLGRQRTPKDHVGPDMRPYLRVANVFEDRICTADVKQMNFSDKEYEIYRLNAGDILLNEGQSLELIGRPAMFRGEVDGCCFQNTLVRFQAARGVNPEFALLTFLDAMHRGRFRRIAKITTNIAHLGAARFAELGFPLPPEEEQSEIVRLYRGQVDDLKSMADTLQTTSSLRQSILAAAFKGELVQ